MPQIDHVFVLMLENRSFDHFFGLSGRVPRPNDPGFQAGATDRATYDPPHEFADVQQQVGPTGDMTGFPPEAKLAFLPSQVPVLTQLASEFLLFDNWFASMPGPTWPNRFFVHAGSSGGLADSPRDSATAALGLNAFSFQRGTVYDQLDAVGKRWTVAHGDNQPQVCAIEGMARKLLLNRGFRPLRADPDSIDQTDFFSDLKAGKAAAYTFIEPDYGLQADNLFGHGESQHPLGAVSAGERLIKQVYEGLRNSPTLWPRSVLLIVWDEHGGFYDSARQPMATAPGDEPRNANRGTEASMAFDFTRLGVRVPALLVSPFAPRGRLGSQVFPGATFDHSSVIASLRETFGLPGPLTQRDATAPTWVTGLLAQPRSGADLPPERLVDALPTQPVPVQAAAAADPFVAGMARIAQDMDRELAGQEPGARVEAPTQADLPAFLHQLRDRIVRFKRTLPPGQP